MCSDRSPISVARSWARAARWRSGSATVLVLVYDLPSTNALFRRFPGASKAVCILSAASAESPLTAEHPYASCCDCSLDDGALCLDLPRCPCGYSAISWRTVPLAAGGMPGNGARIGIEGMTFFRFSSGRIVEEWTIVDIATLREQLS